MGVSERTDVERMTAVSIGPSFGWLHHADGDRGVVMCAAMGYEALCAHHSWRVLADRLAAAGLPTLRFDYPGEGDSLGDPGDPELLDKWRESIRAAMSWMRDVVGVSEVALVGLRLGATLAAEVGGADHLVQIAPVTRGSSYLRELDVMSRMLAASKPPSEQADSGDSALDLEGFTLTPAAREAIKRIDLKRVKTLPARRVLIAVDPSARPVADYAAQLEALGAEVATHAFQNYRAMTPAPLPAPAPLDDLDAIVSWTSSGASHKTVSRPLPSGLADEDFTEQGVRFGPGEHLAGVLCEPRGRVANATVVLLNTGANYHIGCGRSSVQYARALARRGVASLRMDSFGVGDSAVVEGGPRSMLYREGRHGDVSAAVDFLAARGLGNVTLVGTCSGAALALNAAVQDRRVRSVLLANIVVFARMDAEAIEAMLDRAFGATSTYVSKALSARSWRRVLDGDVSLGKLYSIGGALVRRKAQAALAAATSLFGGVGTLRAKVAEAEAKFEALSRRGVRVHILHGEHDVGLEELELCFGPGAKRLSRFPLVSHEILAGVDHALSSPASRDAFFVRLSSFVESVEVRSTVTARKKSLLGAATVLTLGAFALMANME